MDTGKALTVHQPYAALICLGLKRYETRSRRTSVRGPIVIHAARTLPIARGEIRRYGRYELLRDDHGLMLVGDGLPRGGALRLPVGAFIGTATITDCTQVTVDDLAAGLYPRDQIALGDFTPGRWLWHLDQPHPIPPVPGRGQLGFFPAPLTQGPPMTTNPNPATTSLPGGLR